MATWNTVVERSQKICTSRSSFDDAAEQLSEFGFILIKTSTEWDDVLKCTTDFCSLDKKRKEAIIPHASSVSGSQTESDNYFLESCNSGHSSRLETLILTHNNMPSAGSALGELFRKLYRCGCSDAMQVCGVFGLIARNTGDSSRPELVSNSENILGLQHFMRFLKYSNIAAKPHVEEAAAVVVIYGDESDTSLEVNSIRHGWIPVTIPRGVAAALLGTRSQLVRSGRFTPSLHRVLTNGKSRISANFVVESDINVESTVTLVEDASPISASAQKFQCSMSALKVVSEDDVKNHWSLLQSVVVHDGSPLRSHKDEAYWKSQIILYCEYMMLRDHHYKEFLQAGFDSDSIGFTFPDPPRELYYVWIVHMLQPYSYKADCLSAFGQIMPHENHLPTFDMSVMDSLWQDFYGMTLRQRLATKDCFMPSDTKFECMFSNVDWFLAFDGVASVHRDMQLDASEIVMGNSAHIAEVLHSYTIYLSLVAFTDNGSLAPGTAIDFVWHSHMCRPVEYCALMATLPRFIDHNPCGENNPFDPAWAENTIRAWKEYGSRYKPPEFKHLRGGPCCGCYDTGKVEREKRERAILAKQQEEARQKQAAEARELAELRALRAAMRAQEQAEILAKQQAELLAKQQAELLAKQQAELLAKQRADILAKQQAELQAKQQAELLAKQQAELLAGADIETKQRFELLAKRPAALPTEAGVQASQKIELSLVLQQGSKKWGRSKVMIVGEGRAGKTALSRSILGEAFMQTESTVGITELQCDVRYASKGKAGGGWHTFAKPEKELEAAMATMIVQAKKAAQDSIDSLPGANKTAGSSDTPGDSVERKSDATTKHTSVRDVDLNKGGTQPVEIATTVDASVVDEEVLMKCLANDVLTGLDLVVSVFDYGGQPVFNVIHHLFLTQNGVYVLVFNMEWLLEGSLDAPRCFEFLMFWINSIAMHTYDKEKRLTAPFALVGSHGDVVTSPSDHEAISLRLYEKFHTHKAFLSVLDNKTAIGAKGTTKMYFFPVDNTVGMADPSLQNLMTVMEAAMEESEYTQRQVPLTWLHALDEMKSTRKNCLNLREVVEIASRCGISEGGVPSFLHFLHEMGIVLWHDEPGLRDVTIVDAVSYFVAPITILICQHNPNRIDGTSHLTPAHKECQRFHESEWEELTAGVLTQVLLKILWRPYLEHADTLIRLMTKFGLLVRLNTEQSLELGLAVSGATSDDDSNQNKYLVPALLPQADLSNKEVLEWSEDMSIMTCLMLFTLKAKFPQNTNILQKDLLESGFLPSGLFERIVGRVVMCSQNTSLSAKFNFSDLQLYRNVVVLGFGNQRFRLTLTKVNSIRVDIEGHNPLSVHERLVTIIQEVLNECMKELTLFTAVFYSSNKAAVNEIIEEEVHRFCHEPDSPIESPLLLIPLEILRQVVSTKFASMPKRGHRKLLSEEQIRMFYGPWLLLYDLRQNYDIFVSYRWGEQDSAFVQDLFDMLTNFSKGRNKEVIEVFLDTKRLKDGRRFDKDFAKALMNSAVIVPVVSVDALRRMVDHTASRVDNVLLEWVLAIYCFNSERCTTERIFPVAFGPRIASESHETTALCRSLFDADILSQLPRIIPTATLEFARQLLQENGITDPPEVVSAFLSRTVYSIVNDELLKFMLLRTWDIKPSTMVLELTAAKLVELLSECTSSGSTYLNQTSDGESEPASIPVDRIQLSEGYHSGSLDCSTLNSNTPNSPLNPKPSYSAASPQLRHRGLAQHHSAVDVEDSAVEAEPRESELVQASSNAPTSQALPSENDLHAWLGKVLKGFPAAKIATIQQSFEEQELFTLDIIRESLDLLTADFLTNTLGLKAAATHAKITKGLSLLAEEK